MDGVGANWFNYTQPLMVVIRFMRIHSSVFRFAVLPYYPLSASPRNYGLPDRVD